MEPISSFSDDFELQFPMSEDMECDFFTQKENVIPNQGQNLFSKTVEKESAEHKMMSPRKVVSEHLGTWQIGQQRSTPPVQQIPKEEWIDKILQRQINEKILFLLISCAKNDQPRVTHLITEMLPVEICESISYIHKEEMRLSGTDLKIHSNLINRALSALPELQKTAFIKFLNSHIDFCTYLSNWVENEMKQFGQGANRLYFLFQKTLLAWQQKMTKQGYYAPRISPNNVKLIPKVTYKPIHNPHAPPRKPDIL